MKEFTENARVSVSFQRNTNPSQFENNAYFLTHSAGVMYQHDLGPHVCLTVSPGYQTNSYPLPLLAAPGRTPGDSRGDRIYDLLASARYRISDMFAIDFLYDVVRRRSNLQAFNFMNHRVGVSLMVGSRGITHGRAPY